MAKIRMSEALRSRLTGLAEKVVQPKKEAAVLEAAYKKAEPLVRKAVQKKYPPVDMAILKRYNAAYVDDCIKLQLTAGGVETFDFVAKTGPLVAHKTYQGAIYLADEKTTDVVAEWVAARNTYKAEREKRLVAYKALITAARYVEEITAVWPEAAAQLPKRQDLVALNDDALAKIKADIAERRKAA